MSVAIVHHKQPKKIKMTNLNEVKQKLQGLINEATAKNNQQKQTLSFLFDKLNEIKELETIDRLRKFQGGSKYLIAYLTYKSITRSNYQIELTKNADFSDDEENGKGGQERLLEAIAKDIETFEEYHKAKEGLRLEDFNNEKLIKLMTEKIDAEEIIYEVNEVTDSDSKVKRHITFSENKKYIKDQADEFLTKKGFAKKNKEVIDI
jgi:hypothetical protein